MSSVNAINSNVSFGRAKKAEKAEKAEKQPKVSKHIQKRAMEKYGVDYMSLSPEAQKIIKKDINFEYAAIGLTAITTAGLSLFFARGKKLTNGFTEAFINSGKKALSNVPGLGKKFDPSVKDAKGLLGFASDKLDLLLNAKEIKNTEMEVRDFSRDILNTITKTRRDGSRVQITTDKIQDVLDDAILSDKTKEAIAPLLAKIDSMTENADANNGVIRTEDLDDLAAFVQKSLEKTKDVFNKESGLGKLINKIFGQDNAAVVEQKLADFGIKDGASAVDTALAGTGAVLVGNKAGDVMDDATDLNNGEVTEEAVIAHIQERGSEAVLKSFGQQVLDKARDFLLDNVESL